MLTYELAFRMNNTVVENLLSFPESPRSPLLNVYNSKSIEGMIPLLHLWVI